MTTTQRPYDGYAPFDDDLTDYARPQDFRVSRVTWWPWVLIGVPLVAVVLIVWAVGR